MARAPWAITPTSDVVFFRYWVPGSPDPFPGVAFYPQNCLTVLEPRSGSQTPKIAKNIRLDSFQDVGRPGRSSLRSRSPPSPHCLLPPERAGGRPPEVPRGIPEAPGSPKRPENPSRKTDERSTRSRLPPSPVSLPPRGEDTGRNCECAKNVRFPREWADLCFFGPSWGPSWGPH